MVQLVTVTCSILDLRSRPNPCTLNEWLDSGPHHVGGSGNVTAVYNGYGLRPYHITDFTTGEVRFFYFFNAREVRLDLARRCPP